MARFSLSRVFDKAVVEHDGMAGCNAGAEGRPTRLVAPDVYADRLARKNRRGEASFKGLYALGRIIAERCHEAVAHHAIGRETMQDRTVISCFLRKGRVG